LADNEGEKREIWLCLVPVTRDKKPKDESKRKSKDIKWDLKRRATGKSRNHGRGELVNNGEEKLGGGPTSRMLGPHSGETILELGGGWGVGSA